MTCVNCGKFYLKQTNRNFKTRFKNIKKYFIYGEGRSNFGNTIVEEGHEMRNIDNIMTIYLKILEEKDIFKASSSLNILNEVINSRKDPIYQILLSVNSYISTRRQAK